MERTVSASVASPLLSILLPTYSYPDGVGRIVRALDAPGLGDQVEVLIADDSPDDAVQSLVQSLATRVSLPLTYRRNMPALGAAANWNSLLDRARGRFVWLLHHDEFPIGDGFLPRLMSALRRDADVLMLDCLLVDVSTGSNRQHLPMTLRAAIVRHAPGYLLRRNAIGPTSCLVVRRDRYPRFETSLRWLVDVEAYVRLLRPGTVVVTGASLRVGSVLDRGTSISAQIAADLPRLHREELDWLHATHLASNMTPWVALAAGRGVGARVVRGIETVAWVALRVAMRSLAGLRVGSIPRAQALQSLGREP